MSFMVCGQLLFLPVVPGNLRTHLKPKDLKGKIEGTLLRRQPENVPHQKSTQDLKLASCQNMTLWNIHRIPATQTMEKTMRTKSLPKDEVQQQVDEIMMDMIVALAVVALAGDRQPTVKERYANQRRSRR